MSSELHAACVHLLTRGQQDLTDAYNNPKTPSGDLARRDLNNKMQEVWDALNEEWENATALSERPVNEDDWEEACLDWHRENIKNERDRQKMERARTARKA